MVSGGRVACPQCGANNFDTVSACWKCGAALQAVGARPPKVPPQAPPARPMGGSYAVAPPRALRAALWLGLLFPYVGLPVGLIFMMLGEDRYYEAGRTCVLWSCVSLVLHLLVLSLIGIGMREVFFAMLQGARGAADRTRGMGGFGMP